MPDSLLPEIQTVSTRVVYKNRWMTVREDAIVRQDGSHGIYGVVDKTDFAVIVPFLGEQLVLVEQYRYPVGARYLGHLFGAYGYSSQGYDIFVAEVKAMILDGRIQDATTVAVFGLLALRGLI